VITIWKFKLKHGMSEVEMPTNTQGLSVGRDADGTPCIWAQVDTESPKMVHKVYVVGTGEELTPEVCESFFLGTVVVQDRVWHVFYDETLPTVKPLGGSS
jgi:hypothetical protein